MDTVVFAAVVLGLAVVGVAALSTFVRRAERTESEAPRLQHMEKLAEALTKGVALLGTVLGIVAAREGGVGRLVANGGAELSVAVVCTVGSVLVAFAAWVVVGAAPARRVTVLWLAMTVGSIALFAVGVYGVFSASNVAAQKLERPGLSVEQTAQGLKFTATADLLTADDFMRTTVHGYPPDEGPRELLFNSTTGPDAKGKVSVTAAITASLSPYEVVEVRAHRGDIDPGCERPTPSADPTKVPDGACAVIWIVPLTGT
ncbi:MAG TPA: hypothetical protein VHF47_09075 [Acidimicrobiales bacterium]|nr:hypothetical protein [Acidimicrobiales bacterium]